MIAPGVVVSAVGLGALSVGPESGWSVFAGDALYLIGMGMGIWEVSMDVVGARVAHLLGNNAILPRLHATLSIGTVVGLEGQRIPRDQIRDLPSDSSKALLRNAIRALLANDHGKVRARLCAAALFCSGRCHRRWKRFDHGGYFGGRWSSVRVGRVGKRVSQPERLEAASEELDSTVDDSSFDVVDVGDQPALNSVWSLDAGSEKACQRVGLIPPVDQVGSCVPTVDGFVDQNFVVVLEVRLVAVA